MQGAGGGWCVFVGVCVHGLRIPELTVDSYTRFQAGLMTSCFFCVDFGYLVKFSVPHKSYRVRFFFFVMFLTKISQDLGHILKFSMKFYSRKS